MATKDKLNNAFRRVIYDTTVAAKSLEQIPKSGRDFSLKAALKIAALIMARNLNGFLYKSPKLLNGFAIAWKPDLSARLIGQRHFRQR